MSLRCNTELKVTLSMKLDCTTKPLKFELKPPILAVFGIDNGYNFDERDDEITYDNLAEKQPFEPEEAKRRQEEAKQTSTDENAA